MGAIFTVIADICSAIAYAFMGKKDEGKDSKELKDDLDGK